MSSQSKFCEMVDDILSDVLDEMKLNDNMKAVIEYALSGGKRLRPSLLMAFFLRKPKDRAFIESEMYAAASVEFLHTASLIIDDLPCMDNDDYRRSKLSLHKKFGETVAQLTSTSMMCMAIQLLTKAFVEAQYNSLGLKAVELLTEKMGIFGAAGGQMMDQAFLKMSLKETTEGQGAQEVWRNVYSDYVKDEQGKVSVELVEDVIHKKTSTFFELPLLWGVMLAKATDDEAILNKASHLGKMIGLCYQIVDDIEDTKQDWETQGKNASINYVLQFGLDAATERYFQCEMEIVKSYQELGLTKDFVEDHLIALFRQKLKGGHQKAQNFMMSFQ